MTHRSTTGPSDAESSPRALGALISTPGSGLALSASAASGTAVRFGDFDPVLATNFQAFSEERLFAPLGSVVTEVSFSLRELPEASLADYLSGLVIGTEVRDGMARFGAG